MFYYFDVQEKEEKLKINFNGYVTEKMFEYLEEEFCLVKKMYELNKYVAVLNFESLEIMNNKCIDSLNNFLKLLKNEGIKEQKIEYPNKSLIAKYQLLNFMDNINKKEENEEKNNINVLNLID